MENIMSYLAQNSIFATTQCKIAQMYESFMSNLAFSCI